MHRTIPLSLLPELKSILMKVQMLISLFLYQEFTRAARCLKGRSGVKRVSISPHNCCRSSYIHLESNFAEEELGGPCEQGSSKAAWTWSTYPQWSCLSMGVAPLPTKIASRSLPTSTLLVSFPLPQNHIFLPLYVVLDLTYSRQQPLLLICDLLTSHGCFQQTPALPLLLLLPSKQGLPAGFSPTGKRLQEDDPSRMSLQTGHTAEFSAVTQFMIYRHTATGIGVSGHFSSTPEFRGSKFTLEKQGHCVQRNSSDRGYT